MRPKRNPPRLAPTEEKKLELRTCRAWKPKAEKQQEQVFSGFQGLEPIWDHLGPLGIVLWDHLGPFGSPKLGPLRTILDQPFWTNGPKWSHMVQNGPKRSQKGNFWHKMVLN